MIISIGLLILALVCLVVFLWADYESTQTNDLKTKEMVNIFKAILSCIGLLSFFIGVLIQV